MDTSRRTPLPAQLDTTTTAMPDLDHFPLKDASLVDPGLPLPSSTDSFWHSPPAANLHNHRTTPKLPARTHTVIIGSGIAGSFAFHELSRHSLLQSGRRTVMLEARSTCWGATGRNGGNCKPMLYARQEFLPHDIEINGVPEALRKIRFEMANRDNIRNYVEEHGVEEAEYRDVKSADVYFAPSEFARAKHAISVLRQHAPDIADQLRIIDGAGKEGRKELEEKLRTPKALGAVVYMAAKLWPYKLVAAILQRAVYSQQSLNLQTQTPATSISREKDTALWRVSTPRGDILAKRVIVAANAHTSHLLPQFRGYIFPVRAQCMAIKPPDTLISRPLEYSYGFVPKTRAWPDYLIQRPIESDGSGGEFIFGGGRHLAEDCGIGKQDGKIDASVTKYLKRSIASYFPRDIDEDYDETSNTGLQRSFIEKFRRLKVSVTQAQAQMAMANKRSRDVWDTAEGFGLEDEEPVKKQNAIDVKAVWSGTMGFSKDEAPFVGQVPAVNQADAGRLGMLEMQNTRGLWVLAGFEGHGMAFTSGSAKALALMISREENASTTPIDSPANPGFGYFPASFVATPERLGLTRATGVQLRPKLCEELWRHPTPPRPFELAGSSTSEDDWVFVDESASEVDSGDETENDEANR